MGFADAGAWLGASDDDDKAEIKASPKKKVAGTPKKGKGKGKKEVVDEHAAVEGEGEGEDLEEKVRVKAEQVEAGED